MKLVVLLFIVVAAIVYVHFMTRLIASRIQARRRRSIGPASWEPRHLSGNGETRVFVALVRPIASGDELTLERRTIDTIKDGDVAYDDKFILAMDKARQRASTLNSE